MHVMSRYDASILHSSVAPLYIALLDNWENSSILVDDVDL